MLTAYSQYFYNHLKIYLVNYLDFHYLDFLEIFLQAILCRLKPPAQISFFLADYLQQNK